MTKKQKEEVTVFVVPPKKELVLEGDPEKQLEYATKAAKSLMKVVEGKPKKVMINGKQYLEYGAWQTLGRFFGATAGVEWTKRIERDGKYVGYEARGIVTHNGITISSAEASCLITEWNWGANPKKKSDEFAVKSMAQTRACAKALRNAFGWVAELAGYASTPAEEMDGVPRDSVYPSDRNDAPDLIEPVMPEKGKKQVIAELLLKLGHDVRKMAGPDANAKVFELTKLEMTLLNYDEIETRLKVLVEEKRRPLEDEFHQ